MAWVTGWPVEGVARELIQEKMAVLGLSSRESAACAIRQT